MLTASRILCCGIILALYFCDLAIFTVTAKSTKVDSSRDLYSICPSQTINYITATLPQQCLRTDWSRHPEPTVSGVDSPALIVSSAEVSGASSVQHESESNVPSTTKSDEATSASAISAQAKSDEVDIEQDPLSDNANFLSFEDWKARMLQKTGQSPEHVAGTKMNQRKEPRVGGINNALDGYGEDGEIEIEFGGFPIPDVPAEVIPPASSSPTEGKVLDQGFSGEKPQKKSKDAGTTSKHRFNYASFDCAATVLKTNSGSKGSTSILSENKDSYMINACSIQNKFIIVELCNDINIDTIVLGNFEFFSSTFKSFRVSVADRYPVKADKWEDIGTYQARNTRGIQAFLVENMRTWGRYLRIEFLTHYGAEYYCPVSLLRVHGKTMMDDWKANVKASQGEDDDEEEVEDVPLDKVTAIPTQDVTSTMATVASNSAPESKVDPALVSSPFPIATADYSFYDDKCPRVSLPGPLFQQTELVNSDCQAERKFCHMAKIERIAYTSASQAEVDKPDRVNGHPNKADGSELSQEKTKANAKANSASFTSSTSLVSTNTEIASASKSRISQDARTSSGAIPTRSIAKSSDPSVSVQGSGESRVLTSSKTPSGAVASVVPQDSFFRSVHKRLQQLESNSTLSLQYIEEQSRILREAFTKVEKRQLSKTKDFLETLNATVLTELRQFRLQYDQIWQSTVLELSAQREQSQKEVTALSQRLSLLANEMLWQRRLAILQFGLIMLCLALVVFSRSSAGAATFELPMLQNMVAKQTFARSPHLESPPNTPSRPPSRYERLTRNLAVFRSPSNAGASDDGSPDKALNAEGPYQLPTPTGSDVDDSHLMESLESSPEPDLALRRARSEPTLSKESDDVLEGDEHDDNEMLDFVYDHDATLVNEIQKAPDT